MVSSDKARSQEQEEETKSKQDPITVAEIEAIAKQKLPKNVWNYYASGSDDQLALRRNASIFDRYSEHALDITQDHHD